MAYKAFFILLLAAVPFRSLAQKAFETVNYKGKLNNKVIRLALANGYIGASSIKFTSKGKSLVFSPDSGVPDEHNKLIFRLAKYQQPNYFILSNMQEAYQELPLFINGEYYNNKKFTLVKFYLVK